MTNTLAICLGLLILVLLATDIFFLQGSTLLFLAKQLAELIEYVSFWR